MRRLRELVNGLDRLSDVVALIHETLEIPDKGGRVTGNVDDLLGRHLASSGDEAFG